MSQDDPNLVNTAFQTKLADYLQYPEATRQRGGPVLANRINTRRAIRELILPELAAIQSTLADIQKRLERIEQTSTDQSHG